MSRTTITLVLVHALGLLACDPRAGVGLVEAGGRLQVVFSNCTRPAQLLPVSELEVRRISGDKNVPECRLRARKNSTLVTSWQYGEPVEGYETTGCGPLQAGETYEVQVSMGPSFARAVVRREPSGALTTLSGGCS